MESVKNKCLSISNHGVSLVLLFCCVTLVSGCTSLGHSGREEPQIERVLVERPDVVSLEGSGELVIALELMLVSHGVNVLASPTQIVKGTSTTETVVRYAISATSVDLDTCLPEMSRQMHFHISVSDLVENKRVFAMSGNYGCKNSIVQKFEGWFLQ